MAAVFERRRQARWGERGPAAASSTVAHVAATADVLVLLLLPQALHVCGQILQLHGRYMSAQKMYEKAIHLLRECSDEGRLGPPDLLLLQHYAELLLLTKQYAAAKGVAQVDTQGLVQMGSQ